ncbi:hypothetical protein HDU76_005987 [Blyttiomyces sp. JEL0837]|nr:hypothetical protein HDU76_005987 [Blyttiomyces sp. JEL0837]
MTDTMITDCDLFHSAFGFLPSATTAGNCCSAITTTTTATNAQGSSSSSSSCNPSVDTICCDSDYGNIISIRLNGNQFSGFVPDAFSNTQELKVLDLSGNLFQYTLPNSIIGLGSLQSLNVKDNCFSFLPADSRQGFTYTPQRTSGCPPNDQLHAANQPWPNEGGPPPTETTILIPTTKTVSATDNTNIILTSIDSITTSSTNAQAGGILPSTSTIGVSGSVSSVGSNGVGRSQVQLEVIVVPTVVAVALIVGAVFHIRMRRKFAERQEAHQDGDRDSIFHHGSESGSEILPSYKSTFDDMPPLAEPLDTKQIISIDITDASTASLPLPQTAPQTQIKQDPSSSTVELEINLLKLHGRFQTWSHTLIMEWSRIRNLDAGVIEIFERLEVDGIKLDLLNVSLLKDEYGILDFRLRAKVVQGVEYLRHGSLLVFGREVRDREGQVQVGRVNQSGPPVYQG